jgi:long-chain acyl-CoA synthetase
MRVHDLLAQTAQVFPERIAVSHEDRRMTYRGLHQSSDRLAEYLKSLHLNKDTRIAILFENSLEYVVLFFAVLKAGLVAVPLDTSLGADSLAFVLTDCDARVLFAQMKFRRKLPEILKQNNTVNTLIADAHISTGRPDLAPVLLSSIIGEPDTYSEPNVPGQDQPQIEDSPLDMSDPSGTRSPHELAAIFYTSGSTGSGKGVMLSHRNLVSNTIGTVQYLRLTPNDSIMVILPFYYIYGNSLLLTHVACGGRIVIDNRFLYSEVVLDTMEQEKVTGFSGVPSNFLILLGNSSFATRKLEHLRYFTQAGGAMAPETVRKLIAVFGHKEIFIMYGQTEAAPRVTWLPPERLNEKVGSIGIAVPGITIEVLDDDGKTTSVGQTGEIVVSGPNVMMGYWNQPNENREVLKDGKLHTGDLAKWDEDGYLWVVGRKKEIIKSGGNRVSAKEVEECLLANDKILEATVVGVPDNVLGEAIRAVVVLKAGHEADPKEIQTYCRKNLADFKVPKQVVFIDALPKYQSGKVNKPLLKTEEIWTLTQKAPR